MEFSELKVMLSYDLVDLYKHFKECSLNLWPDLA
jgi:hypothetical protein